MATALDTVTWKRLQTTEGLSQYQKQNMVRLKAWKLYLWRNADHGVSCAGDLCQDEKGGGQAHLVWECPDAQAFWVNWLRRWGLTEREVSDGGAASALGSIFSFRCQDLPTWLIEWGRSQEEAVWEVLFDVANEMWVRGCAATVTAIWRRNVERVHPEGAVPTTLDGAVAKWVHFVADVFCRFRLSCYPLRGTATMKIAVVNEISRHWWAEIPTGSLRLRNG
ncbi:hypothetical protein PC129_g19895 [Phytophthora cactorum]|uniref:Reverse transcriptase zinc-binding domain-containing protein n=1 Tax=Phytophthora cactorum TaxID=29920 RepID=A0A329SF31_9STRA|nr:hypothetical protein Pcac1_g16396 [Phytophthora cactorum]KAG2898260.1 hypothetical protein PC117_g22601 [Phytophthora cactorum]KAG2906586.1 hypothetical protein PC114_g11094 [Phytophthora cactorum]KAG2982768.1 hypothetical protein PC118_g9798 [Phytophthora cactorum]KAG3010164.1 hypothetical protein PC120_g15233 [Phytophthora cactorum]